MYFVVFKEPHKSEKRTKRSQHRLKQNNGMCKEHTAARERIISILLETPRRAKLKASPDKRIIRASEEAHCASETKREARPGPASADSGQFRREFSFFDNSYKTGKARAVRALTREGLAASGPRALDRCGADDRTSSTVAPDDV
ncbi:hypothetical protein EVAR_64005_1 [Eumeta japonica]|uniref:Uncharacterized protein n=1 Tax=Eumeta variegata TaxID=151549 RepID=A0A4C1YZD4_EUMVA|nr:hypothetical protein EVAR_64005_1 [Eumeta japonica]